MANVSVKLSVTSAAGFAHRVNLEWDNVEDTSFFTAFLADVKTDHIKKTGDGGELTMTATVDIDGAEVVTESLSGVTRNDLRRIERGILKDAAKLVDHAEKEDKRRGKK